MPYQIQLVVFNLVGTTTKFGSKTPVQKFDRALSQYGFHSSRQEISAPMVMEKKDHTSFMLSTEYGWELWKAAKGQSWNEQDEEPIYQSVDVINACMAEKEE